MSDREALLAAIRANPAEDSVRLVYADWLDERGEGERAEFIRVQIGLNQPPGMVSESQRREMLAREDALMMQHRDRWFPVPSGFGLAWSLNLNWFSDLNGRPGAYIVARGFVGAVMTTAENWMLHADAILADHPVQAVRLMTMPTFGTGNFIHLKALLERRWPGIEFTLLLAGASGTVTLGGMTLTVTNWMITGIVELADEAMPAVGSSPPAPDQPAG